ncbi:MAG TPA: PBP1A family penicillin-binding protein [Actinomycetota bacterium]|nr:PBP1A family penicillin-binding protein [Actinomycetota bacterium]
MPRTGVSIPGRVGRAVMIPFILVLTAAFVAAGIAPIFAGVGQAIKKFNAQFGADSPTNLEFGDFPERSTIYARDGSVLATVAQYNRVSISLDEVNQYARDAVLAIEDDGFYTHGAVDFTAIVRAALANLRAGEVVQGGSTITQQLVKNIYVGTEQTFARKFQEAQDAIRLERTYTKDQIFEQYLNEVYFGNGTYGIEAAAEFYFAKHASELSLPQAALLAGLVKAPGQYNPIEHKDQAHQRRDTVLLRMRQLGWITEGEYVASLATKVKLSKRMRDVNKLGPEPYFVDYVRQLILDPARHSPWYRQIIDTFGKTKDDRERLFYQGGLKIYTTLDPKLQAVARNAVERNLPNQGPKPPADPEGAIVSIDSASGRIRAMYGGQDFSEAQFNLATRAQRQAGSAFKAFTLTAAFEQGMPPGKVYKAQSPVEIPQDKCPNTEGAGPWMPANAEPGEGGFMNLWTATAFSVNVVFAQLIADIGPTPVVDAAYRMGVRGPDDTLNEQGIHARNNTPSSQPTVVVQPVCAITLGAVAVNPLAMTTGFATLANGGVHCEPFAIEKVVSRDGKRLFKTDKRCEQAIAPDIAAQVTALLRGVVTGGGTGWRAALDRPVAGKTGTSQDHADLWFVGYVPQIATGVWVGYSKDEKTEIPSSLDIFSMPEHGSGAFGGSIAAPIWHDYMAEAVKGLPVKDFPTPPPERSGTVPNVVGMKEDKAVQTLAEASFTADVQQKDSTEPKGTVFQQNPAGGASARLGSIVTVFVSTGVAPKATVPNVLGMTEAEARKALTNAGFMVAVEYAPVRKPENDGKVVGQDPAGGTSRDAGTTVSIAVGVLAGPSPSPSPSPG